MNRSSLTFATALLAATLLGGVSATRAGDAPGAGIRTVCDEDFLADGRYPDARIELGRLLFFDKLLSGNRNISCATCHHPTHGRLRSPASRLGEGALGLGPERPVQESAPALGRIPRAGIPEALSTSAAHGVRLFYGGAGCNECHSGRFQTDHSFR